MEQKIARLKNQLDSIGGMDELTLKEYQETESRYTTLSSQVEDLKRGMGDLRQIMDDLDVRIKQTLMKPSVRLMKSLNFISGYCLTAAAPI